MILEGEHSTPCKVLCGVPQGTVMVLLLLNQAHAVRPARTWFPKIDPVRMSVCVCVSAPRLLITSGVIWTTNDWL